MIWLSKLIAAGMFCAVFVPAAQADSPYADGLAAYDKDQYEIAYRLWSRGAEAGDAASQAGLGRLYRLGKGVEQDYAKALPWIRKSAAQGEPLGKLYLAYMHRDGEGVVADKAAAYRFALQAAEQGLAEAQYALGWYLSRGSGIAVDHVTAIKWWQKAAAQSNADAEFELGKASYLGEGAERNLEEAADWFRRAADHGSTDGLWSQGVVHLKGEGVPKDEALGASLILQAAQRGNRDAQFDIANLSFKGVGTAKSPEQGIHWYREAATNGHALAAVALAAHHISGQYIKVNYGEAERLARPYAEAGDPLAQSILGSALYLAGRAKGKVEAEAAKWMAAAAEADVANAQFTYALMLFNGEGTARDPDRATEWIRKAAAAGQKGAQCILSVLDLSEGDGVAESIGHISDALARSVDPECKEWGVTVSLNLDINVKASD